MISNKLMDIEQIRYVVTIQCNISKNRCSGFACENDFHNRVGIFEGYGEDVRNITLNCGGCSGKGVAAKLENLGKQMRKNTDIKKDQVAIHLSSCMVSDNHHSDRCPNIDYIKSIIAKKGYKNVVEGSHFSTMTSKKREAGIYKDYFK